MRLPGRAQGLLAAGGALCTAVGGIVIWKDRLGGDVFASRDAAEAERPDRVGSQEGKVFVVTGANSGIGRAVTWELARLRGRVYMACRDMDRCEEARKEIVLDTGNK